MDGSLWLKSKDYSITSAYSAPGWDFSRRFALENWGLTILHNSFQGIN